MENAMKLQKDGDTLVVTYSKRDEILEFLLSLEVETEEEEIEIAQMVLRFGQKTH